MTPKPTASLLLASVLLAASSLAQDVAKPDLPGKLALATKALRNSGALRSFTFTSTQQTTRLGTPVFRGAAAGPVAAAGAAGGGAGGPPAFAAAAPAAGPSKVEGGVADDLLWANAAEGRDQMVWRGRRMIARQGQGPWQLRQGCVGEGHTLAKLVDPDRFFPALVHAKLEVLAAAVGSLQDRPIEIVTLHAGGNDAYELLWSGLLPDLTAPRVAAVGGRVAQPRLEIDVAVWLDPAAALVHQIKVHYYMQQPSTTVPAVAAGDAEAQGAQPDAAKAHELVIDGGLPVRKPKDKEQWTLYSFDLTFADHGTARPPALDATARELLGLPAGR